MFFSFSGDGFQSAQGLHWIIFPGVHDAHLFILQFNASSFGVGWWGEMALLFSVQCGIGRLSMG
jgi:hypothetical protein